MSKLTLILKGYPNLGQPCFFPTMILRDSMAGKHIVILSLGV